MAINSGPKWVLRQFQKMSVENGERKQKSLSGSETISLYFNVPKPKMNANYGPHPRANWSHIT